MSNLENKQCVDNKQKKRIIYFDILRIIAIFAVIMVHVSAQNWYKTNVFSFEWNVFNIYDSIFKGGALIFVMISGALFLNSNYSIEKIYKKNISKILIVFAIWSLIYTFLFYKYHTLNDFMISFSRGEYHLWFLYMITGLYILVPFLKKIVEDEYLMKYFFILSFIFSIIFKPLKSLFIILKLDFLKSVLFTNILDKLDMNFVLGYSFYFVLGYFLHKIIIDEKKMKYLCILGVLGALSTIIFTALISRYLGKPNGVFYNSFGINILLKIVFIFLVVKNFCENFQFTDKQIDIIIKLSKYSFGIYLVHVLVLKYLKLFVFNTLSFNPIFSVPVIGIVVFCISLLISVLLNKIPFVNKYII